MFKINASKWHFLSKSNKILQITFIILAMSIDIIRYSNLKYVKEREIPIAMQK